MHEIGVSETPEANELREKLAELRAVQSALGESELELATLTGELRSFETRYLRLVGVRQAELDELEAQIAELVASADGTLSAAEAGGKARARATESAAAVEGAAAMGEPPADFRPRQELKDLYRRIAKAMHPDLGTDDHDRERRERAMAAANKAYAEGDETELRRILEEWASDPEAVRGDDTGAKLVRTIRQIAGAKRRLSVLRAELQRISNSDLFVLRKKVIEAQNQGRDILLDMARQIDSEIGLAKERLRRMRYHSENRDA